MTKPKKKTRDSRQPVRLREQAVASLEKSPQEVSGPPGGDVQKLIHELGVHQVELEKQNEQMRHTQFELENTRYRFTLLYDLSPVGYLMLDVEGVIREANLTAVRMLGLDRAALLKKKLAHFVAVESQDDFYLNRRLVFTTTDRQACELQMRRADGSSFRGRFEGVLEPTEPGEPVCCLVALSDVTRHRQAENALRESQAQLAGIIRSAMDAILTVNSPQRIVLCNEAAEKMFGYPSGTLMGGRLDDLIPKAARPARSRLRRDRRHQPANGGARQPLRPACGWHGVSHCSVYFPGRGGREGIVHRRSARHHRAPPDGGGAVPTGGHY